MRMEAEPPEAVGRAAVAAGKRRTAIAQARLRCRNIPESYKGRTRSPVMAVSLGQPDSAMAVSNS